MRIVMVEHMDQVLAASLVVDDPAAFLRQGDHQIDDIFDVPPPPPEGGGEGIPSPAGVN
jgi:hypothetical protein